ncbi:MAG: hypothetical protein KA248_14350 [Kiritimatiellae bacterium]|nr:hypothetical protein [Kiritimatiellia bacterium]
MKTKSWLPALALYVLAGLLLLLPYRDQINPDGVAYLSIAGKYARGEFRDTINAYWGPLLSWLLAPLLALGIPGLLAGKLLNFGLGLLTLAAVQRLLRPVVESDAVRALALLLAAPIVLYYGYLDLSPDLLLATALLLYLAALMNPGYASRWTRGAACGLYAGLAYWAKQYGLIFFLAHFVSVSAALFLRPPAGAARRAILRNLAAGLLVAGLMAGAWAGALTWKYGKFTLGTSGAINVSLFSPELRGVVPHHHVGLLPLPNDTACSAWEDPTFYPIPPWSPLESPAARRYAAGLFLGNVKSSVRIFLAFSLLSWAVLAATLFLGAGRRKDWPRAAGWLGLWTIALYTGGYLPICVYPRYLALPHFLLLLLAMMLLDALWKRPAPAGAGRLLPAALLALSFLYFPASKLYSHAGHGRAEAELGRRLREFIPPGSRLASDSDYYRSLFTSYHLAGRYLGKTRDGAEPAAVLEELAANGVEFYLAWEKDTEADGFLAVSYPELTSGQIPGVRVFTLTTAR